jgi:hypothetical protein
LLKLPSRSLVMADRAYDINAIYQQVQSQDACQTFLQSKTNPGKAVSVPSSIVGATPSSAWSVLKDFRRIAARYDKLATNFVAAIVS